MAAPVLVVDDSILARVATTRLLGHRGLSVSALASSAEALAVDPCGLAAALLDLELGDGFGTDVARRLRIGAPGLPIAFLTGGGPEPLMVEARAIGPVFSKVDAVEEAIRWIVEAVAPPA